MISDSISGTEIRSEKQSWHADADESSTVMVNDERFIAIERAELMASFFLTMVSATNHWFFVSSQGALTAGRGSPDTALFPYYTVDKIMDNWNVTGPQTVIQAGSSRWEPFKPYSERHFDIQRRLLKSINSDSIIFEETNLSLQLRFTYRWRTSERFGFIRTVMLQNLSEKQQALDVVDGLENFLPAGLDQRTQNVYSCLGDAYKQTEIDAGCGLLVHRMASGLTDEAVPMEVLLATTVWSHGWPQSRVLGQRSSAMAFLDGLGLSETDRIRAARGAYYNAGRIILQPRAKKEWGQVAEILQTQSNVALLSNQLTEPDKLWEAVCADMDNGSERLEGLLASSDGCQLTADTPYCAHHRSNVLFNIMRGGVFADNYSIDRELLINSIRVFKKNLRIEEEKWLNSLPDKIGYPELIVKARQQDSEDIVRLCREHLPLVFSRRHGDPSRPWNRFNIKTKDFQGRDLVGFEGNWRDIFQNWEALSYSFPRFNDAFLNKFLNASTADGYNPYRITSRGVDWEKPDPNDPWASIGYWGDHQIIYLLKFLEFSEHFNPNGFRSMLHEMSFVFADVPYEVKSFTELVKDPKQSIRFNKEHDRLINDRVTEYGADGKLLHDVTGALHRVSLMEKLLIPALVKLSNFCPGGGIWMNTQRPEWNDANNALAGWGLSMVTTSYLYRYLCFLQSLVVDEDISFQCSESVLELLSAQQRIFKASPELSCLCRHECYNLFSQLGLSGEQYRERVYAKKFGSQSKIRATEISEWIKSALEHVKSTIVSSQRSDGLFHSYNTLCIDAESKSARVKHLGEMLEGQVAVLSSGILSPLESIAVLEALRSSQLYCPQRNSYVLYPDKELPAFLEMGRVPMVTAKAVPLLARLLEQGDTSLIEYSPSEGCCRFNANLANRFELDKVLDGFESNSELVDLIAKDRGSIHQIYEATFNHQSFTGRSGSMFAYEGLGSIYWHMVSKLMLAVAEIALQAAESDDASYLKLRTHYYTVQDGLGFRKTSEEYGAFPPDAYSHTPAHAGAQQPGLTGMVKEGILARFAELGVSFVRSRIRFKPRLLRDQEFLQEDTCCRILSKDGTSRELNVPERGLLFTLAQTPIIYQLSDRDTTQIQVYDAHGTVTIIDDDKLPSNITAEIIDRMGSIDHLVVRLSASNDLR
ncbi:hypothetical protein [Cerasicoccus arenae]|uniref:Uncharacterized protein n=1 Tax=Cerasicoccus arenae TaxID=424488 RepID=A0A8J3DI63_9BACT|nr:hypothetical protein [Cerasicoccus arenae]MBK1859616.1 hypothetical protein [Cerasicoccus arenae]GHC03557.1 hypothetical protein GCM10007047_20200 [Cerasicoccus arenae]